MKIFYLCNPKRNNTCRAVVRTECKTLISTDRKQKYYRDGKFTVFCMNSHCKHTLDVKAARRILGIPLVDVAFTIKGEIFWQGMERRARRRHGARKPKSDLSAASIIFYGSKDQIDNPQAEGDVQSENQ